MGCETRGESGTDRAVKAAPTVPPLPAKPKGEEGYSLGEVKLAVCADCERRDDRAIEDMVDMALEGRPTADSGRLRTRDRARSNSELLELYESSEPLLLRMLPRCTATCASSLKIAGRPSRLNVGVAVGT